MKFSSMAKRATAIAAAILLAASPAAAIVVPATGIQVTVINSDMSDGAGTCVNIFDSVGDYVTGLCDLEGGVYLFDALEPGTYYILSGWNYDEEYHQFYDGVIMFADASPVTVVGEEITYVTFQSQAFPYLFSDVSPSSPFYHAIAKLANEEAIGGFDDGTFRPAANVTRQAFAAFVSRMLMDGLLFLEPADYVPAGQSFPDVPTDHPFYKEIELLAEYGIAGGYDDGNFRPSAAISRQAAAAFLYRLAELLTDPIDGPDWFGGYAIGDGPEFSDVADTHPFYEEINWLAWTAITTGYDDGTFRSSNTITRQAVAAFLFRFFDAHDRFWSIDGGPIILASPATLNRGEG